jgi:carboxylesterase
MKSSSDEDPDQEPATVDTGEFFLPGGGLSALLIHGLTGTPYEMRYLGERLSAAGFRVHGVRLAGHGGAPEDLGATSSDNWYESVVEGFERLRQFGGPKVVIGLSMGAVLAARLAADQREEVSALVMLSPAFFLPFWTRTALRCFSPVAAVVGEIYLRKASSDIHDDAARQAHPRTGLLPLSAALNLVKLSDAVRPKLARVTQPTLVIHSRRDHTCPYEKNVDFILAHLGSERKRVVTLEESFHVISVDSEKERVAESVLGFVGQFKDTSRPACAMGA